MKLHVTSLNAFGHECGEGGEILCEPDGGDESAEGFVVVDLSESEGGIDGGVAVSGATDESDGEWHAEFAFEFIIVSCPEGEGLM